MSANEVQFKVDDVVIVPGGATAEVMAVYTDERQSALVCFPDGVRELYALDRLQLAPEGAVDLSDRYPAP